ncbi:DUF3800 domain-containing protein [Lentzea rhizosphaerae]|uniref:DUF3800 domain-containing protein n=1 Tax=Lentzea rhizosphaerae TaxID=2041025 RepID=A0ABV8BXK3_9PSEU
MHLIFIDDSQQTDPPRRGLGSLVALGGVVVPENQVAPYAAALAALRTELGMPDGEEIKWKPPRGSYLATAGKEIITNLRTRMLQTAIDHDIRSIVVIIDHGAAYKNRTTVEVGKELLKWLFERVTILLSKAADIGLIIADKPGGGPADEGRWLADTLNLTNDGTEYVEPGKIVLPILTAPSHHVPHLQLADLVTAASTAAVAGRLAGLELKDLLRQLAHRNAHNDAWGAGIVLFPQEMINLCYWAFGETSASKVAMNTGITLPDKRFDYFNDDGLGTPSATQTSTTVEPQL